METQQLIIQPEYLSQLWSRNQAQTKICGKQIFSKNQLCASLTFSKTMNVKQFLTKIDFSFHKSLSTQTV